MADVVVETGANIDGANSYISVAYFETYAEQQGWDLIDYTDDQVTSAIVRAGGWIDLRYRSRFPGVKSTATQPMLWPRKAGSYQNGVFVQDRYYTTVLDGEGFPIAVNAIPSALMRAQAEAAWRELQTPGSLAPDLDRGGAIRSLRAGSVAIEYAGNAPAGTVFSVIDGILAEIICADASAYTGRVVRS